MLGDIGEKSNKMCTILMGSLAIIFYPYSSALAGSHVVRMSTCQDRSQ